MRVRVCSVLSSLPSPRSHVADTMANTISYVVIGFLVVFSVILVILTMGTGISAIYVGTDRIKKGTTTSYIYTILTAATVSAVASSFLLTVTVALMFRLLRDGKKAEAVERQEFEMTKEVSFQKKATLTLREEKSSSIRGDSGELVRDVNPNAVSAHTAEWYQFYNMRPLTAGGCLLIFIAVLCGQLAPLAVLWTKAYAIRQANGDVTKRHFFAFYISEILAGIVAPLLMLTCAAIMAAFTDYTSFGRVDARGLIPYILPSVKLFKTPEHTYWVIVDTFYIRNKTARPQGNRASSNWFSTCDKSLVTWSLGIMIALIFMEAGLTYAGVSLSIMVVYKSCEDVEVDLNEYTCYTAHDLEYVDCSPTNGSYYTSSIRCLQFDNSIGIRDFIQDILAAYVVYQLALQIFGLVFTIVKSLLRCRPTRLWGGIVVLTGVTVLLCSIVFLGLASRYVLFQYKVGKYLQFVILGVYIIMTGVLVLVIKWQKKGEDEEEIELVGLYSDTPRERLSSV